MNLHSAWDGTLQAPCPPLTHERWLRDIDHWRAERRIRTAYDPSRYDLPALRWTQSSFMQPQMMVHDRYFYDPVAGRYTVDRYLDDLNKRYGGIDAVLVWATYPNMGSWRWSNPCPEEWKGCAGWLRTSTAAACACSPP
jgi:hypothetical protein